MNDLVPVRRALLSVSDKTGLAEFAGALHGEFHVELISTGGTARFLRDQGLPITDVSAVTGFPEMMDGRIKTLHPKIHGGLLAVRDNPDHAAAMAAHDILPIDLVCINLYPFAKTIEKPNVSLEEAIENIDIGGPAMIRSAAKNNRYVLVVTSPERYEKVLGDLRQHNGSSCAKHRLKQAQRAFVHTAEYDGLIAKYLAKVLTPQVEESEMPLPYGGPARFLSEPRSGAIATAAGLRTEEPEKRSGGASKLVQRLLHSQDSPEAFLNDLVMTQAVSVAGTEAVAFVVEASGSSFTLKPVVHIRPDESDANTRTAALNAFEALIRPCVESGRDGALVVGPANADDDSQYCLVTLLHSRPPQIAAVSAVVLRCRDLQAAKWRLATMRLIGGYFELASLRSDRSKPSSRAGNAGPLPVDINPHLHKSQDLRYGENPHQKAALYIDRQPAEASVAFAPASRQGTFLHQSSRRRRRVIGGEGIPNSRRVHCEAHDSLRMRHGGRSSHRVCPRVRRRSAGGVRRNRRAEQANRSGYRTSHHLDRQAA